MPARETLRRRVERANQTTAIGVALALLVLGMYGHIKQRYLALGIVGLVGCLLARSVYLRRSPCPGCGRRLGRFDAPANDDPVPIAICPHCGAHVD